MGKTVLDPSISRVPERVLPVPGSEPPHAAARASKTSEAGRQMAEIEGSLILPILATLWFN